MLADKKVVIITGAAGGIGSALVAKFLENNFHVIGTGRQSERPQEKAEWDAADVRYECVDLADRDRVKEFLAVIRALPRLDVLINCAGMNIIEPYSDVSEDNFDILTELNFKAPFFLGQAAADVMKVKGGGHIVNIGSIWSSITKKGRVNYCSSKAGLAGMSRSMATDLAEFGILVNCVSPGFIVTQLTRDSLSPKEMDELASNVPLMRMGQPEEVAELVYFLSSSKNTYLTGQNIILDGGFANV